MNFCLHGSARTIREAVERAKRAEELGFEATFFADSQMNNVDPFQAMALCAVNTKPSASARPSPTSFIGIQASSPNSLRDAERNLRRPGDHRHGHGRRAGLQFRTHCDQARRL